VDAKSPQSRWPVIDRDQVILYILGVALVAVLGVRAAMDKRRARRSVRKIAASQTLRYRIDINRADSAELDLLPGIGRTFAERIVADRETRGPYRSVADLARVSGLSADRVKSLEPLITVGPAETGGEPPQ